MQKALVAELPAVALAVLLVGGLVLLHAGDHALHLAVALPVPGEEDRILVHHLLVFEGPVLELLPLGGDRLAPETKHKVLYFFFFTFNAKQLQTSML